MRALLVVQTVLVGGLFSLFVGCGTDDPQNKISNTGKGGQSPTGGSTASGAGSQSKIATGGSAGSTTGSVAGGGAGGAGGTGPAGMGGQEVVLPAPGGGGTLSTGGSTTGGAIGNTGGSTGGTTAESPCVTEAKDYCAKLDQCATSLLAQRYLDVKTCISIRAGRCELPVAAVPDSGTIADPAQCKADTIELSCLNFLAVESDHPAANWLRPESCKPSHGTRIPLSECNSDNQCVSGHYCAGAIGACTKGSCNRVLANDSPNTNCLRDNHDNCDVREGYRCTNKYAAEAETRVAVSSLGCWKISLGEVDDDCAPDTQNQCKPGLYCSADFKCKPALPPGVQCTVDSKVDPCNQLLGDACKDVPGSNGADKICTPLDIAPVGAQCGTFKEGEKTVVRTCAGDIGLTFCDTNLTPNQCVARKKMGEVCVSEPDNCVSELRCRSGICKAPDQPTCQ